jgi:hypothetical protein
VHEIIEFPPTFPAFADMTEDSDHDSFVIVQKRAARDNGSRSGHADRDRIRLDPKSLK